MHNSGGNERKDKHKNERLSRSGLTNKQTKKLSFSLMSLEQMHAGCQYKKPQK